MAVIGDRVTFGKYGFDEQWFLWGGWSILKGLAPYRDFHDYKPPVLFLSEAAAIAVFGAENQRFRLFFLGLAMASVAALVVASIVRGVGALLSLAIGLLVSWMYLDPAYHDPSVNDAESIALAYYLFGLASLMAARNRAWLQRAGAACFTLCVLTKEPFVFLVLPTWLTFFFDPPPGEGAGGARRKRDYVKASVVGAAVPAALVLLYLAIVGGLEDYLLGYPRTRVFASTYAAAIHRFIPGTFLDEQRQTWGYLRAGLFNLAHLAPWLPLLIAGLLATKRRHLPRLACALLAFAGSVYAVSIGHCFWNHYFVTSVGGLALLAAISGLEIASLAPNPWMLRLAGAIALATLLPSVGARYATDARWNFTPVRPDVPAALLDYISRNTGPNDYVLSSAPIVYFLTNRRGAITYNSFLDEVLPTFPGATDTERFAALRAQMQAHMPKVVYVEPLPSQRNRRHLDELVTPFLAANGYTLVQGQFYVRPY